MSTVGPDFAPDSFTAEPSTTVEHAADSSATEISAIYTSRIRKKLPCATPNTVRGRRVSKRQLTELRESRRVTRNRVTRLVSIRLFAGSSPHPCADAKLVGALHPAGDRPASLNAGTNSPALRW